MTIPAALTVNVVIPTSPAWTTVKGVKTFAVEVPLVVVVQVVTVPSGSVRVSSALAPAPVRVSRAPQVMVSSSTGV